MDSPYRHQKPVEPRLRWTVAFGKVSLLRLFVTVVAFYVIDVLFDTRALALTAKVYWSFFAGAIGLLASWVRVVRVPVEPPTHSWRLVTRRPGSLFLFAWAALALPLVYVCRLIMPRDAWLACAMIASHIALSAAVSIRVERVSPGDPPRTIKPNDRSMETYRELIKAGYIYDPVHDVWRSEGP